MVQMVIEVAQVRDVFFLNRFLNLPGEWWTLSSVSDLQRGGVGAFWAAGY